MGAQFGKVGWPLRRPTGGDYTPPTPDRAPAGAMPRAGGVRSRTEDCPSKASARRPFSGLDQNAAVIPSLTLAPGVGRLGDPLQPRAVLGQLGNGTGELHRLRRENL